MHRWFICSGNQPPAQLPDQMICCSPDDMPNIEFNGAKAEFICNYCPLNPNFVYTKVLKQDWSIFMSFRDPSFTYSHTTAATQGKGCSVGVPEPCTTAWGWFKCNEIGIGGKLASPSVFNVRSGPRNVITNLCVAEYKHGHLCFPFWGLRCLL